MKSAYWFILFLLVFGVELVAIGTHQDDWRYVTKPLLMITLAIWFFTSVKGKAPRFSRFIGAALLFSWLGDVFLLFESRNALFFLLGLSSFLVAHLAYILAFTSIAGRERISNNRWLLLPVMAYYVVMMRILSPHLSEMAWPVRIYGGVISVMLLQSLQLFRLKEKGTAILFVCGALLFVLSDSLLAINKFYAPFSWAGLAVMFTYGLAQVLLVRAAMGYIQSSNE